MGCFTTMSRKFFLFRLLFWVIYALVLGMISQVSKIEWVGVLLDQLIFTFLRSHRNFFTGIFFFTLALFGFSCLSSLGLFANERILFMRERCVIGVYHSLHPPSDPYTEQTDIIHHSRTFRPRYVEQPTLTVCFLIICVL